SYSLATTEEEYDMAFKDTPESLFNFIVDTKEAGGTGLVNRKVLSTTFPIKNLLDAEPALAYIGGDEDPDGIFRQYPLISNADSIYIPSLSLLSYQLLSDDKPVLEIAVDGNAVLKFKNGQIPLNNMGEAKVRWTGGVNKYPEVGLAKILEAKDDDPAMIAQLKDNLVFIGSTAFGAHDLRHTPVDAKLPGIYFHMNMVQMLLEGKYFQTRDKSLIWSAIILLLGTILMIIISLFKHPIIDALFLVAYCVGFFIFDTYYLLPQGYQVTLFFSLLAVALTYSWNTILNFYLANKDKQFLKQAFSNYISPELIDEMYSSGTPPKLGGDSGIRTAYFTDIQGFSTFSEKLSATKLVELLNEYLTDMTDVLLHDKGTLDKYEGDAIIAFFGAPLPLEDHAARACKVALNMQGKLDLLRVKWTAEGDKWPKFVHDMRMRIGINSGDIVTGNMGSKNRMNYTMMGDSVNLAARLEEAAKQYGIFTHVTSFTKDLTGDQFDWRELDTIRVVGKSEPVTTFELLGEKGKTDKLLVELLTKFNQGIALYKAQKWDEAIKTFTATLELEYQRFPMLKHKTNPSKIYIERCETFKNNPPPANWDGVYTLTEK
ncbi:MAG: adenylate/guanylate cyclase domain-containing protein, partial [Bacteriovoracaceae bacterium]